jgi:hypothetical protein
MSLTSPSPEEKALADHWARRLAYEPPGRPAIDAEVVRALLTGEGLPPSAPTTAVPPGAVRIKGVRIGGSLDLSAVKGRVGGGAVPQFEAEDCDFDAPLDLDFAAISGLWLLGCRLPALWIRDARIDGRLDLRGSKIAGVRAEGAGAGLVAVLGDGARIGGDVILSPHDGQRFAAGGAVTLVGARIDGQVAAVGARLTNSGAYALDLQGARVGGGVFLHGAGDLPFEALGGVCMAGAEVASLTAYGAELTGAPGDCAFRGDGLVVRGLLALGGDAHGFAAEGPVRLTGAQLGELRIERAWLDNPTQPASNQPGEDATALDCDRAIISGAVALSRVETNGAVRFAGARLGNAFQLSDGVLEGHVTLEGATVEGRLSIRDVSIQPGRRRPEEPVPTCFDFTGVTVRGALEVAKIGAPTGGADRPDGLYRLDGAEAGGLRDDPSTAWPAPGHLRLDGFTYGWIESIDDPKDKAVTRLAWLGLQHLAARPLARRRRFNPQPYEHLAKILREEGSDREADEVAKRKRDVALDFASEHCLSKAFGRVMKCLGHGYDREAALKWTLLWWTFGVVWISIALYAGAAQFARVNPVLSRPGAEPEGIAYGFRLASTLNAGIA